MYAIDRENMLYHLVLNIRLLKNAIANTQFQVMADMPS